MQRRSFLAVVGAAPFDLTLSDVMAATPDPWAAGFAAARAQYPWLAGYQGVSADMPSRALKVEGAFPPALRGAFYRNGPARHEIGGVRYHHLFDGDGLIQRYDISEQGVTHRGVFVRTDKFVADTAAGRPLRATFGTARPDMEPVTSSDSINAANTSLVMHGDEMLALWEGGSATRVDPNSLRTRGVQIWHDDYKGMPFSAHPKVEPDGTLWNFGVSSAAGLLTVYCVGADSALKRVESVKVPDVAMVHDFAVTQQHLVFLLPPFVYDVERMHAGMSFLDSHVWRPELGMRVLVLDKNDITRMRWLQLPAGFVFHLGNAWSSPDGQEIHLDYIRSDDATVVTTSLRELMRGQIRPAPGAHLAQVRLNLPTGRAEQVSTGHVAEFPKIDTRRTAQRHRTLFMVAYTAPPAGGGGPQALPGYDTVMRFDADSGQVQQYRFGRRTLVEEHVFVPASATAREGQGWLVGTVFDADGGCTRLTAFDAQNVGAGPVAMASLDGVAPLGLHGLFRAA